MSPEVIFVFCLLALAVYLFISERMTPDQTSFTILLILLAAGTIFPDSTLPDSDALVGVFANPAPLTIGAMFIISAALERSGALEGVAGVLRRVARLGIVPVLFLMTLVVGGISAFMNNTPVVVIFVPIILSLAREMQTPASKLLIPLSYASVFGGICTLVGTSTNILASGILTRSGLPPLGMFELASIGVPLLLIGAVFVSLLGHRLLPRRDTLTALLSDEERKEFITTAYVHRGSPLIGKALKESGLLKGGVRIIEIIRSDVSLTGDPREAVLEEGDRLVIAARPGGLSRTRSLEGVNVGQERDLGIETIAAHEGSIVEGVVAPRSSLIGRTIAGVNFRQRYRMIVLAIHRRGANLRQGFENVPLAFGDTVLMMGTDEAREHLRTSDDLLLLDRPETPSRSTARKRPIVIATLAAVVLAASIGAMPIVVASLVGAGVLLLTNCVSTKEAYASIDWSILILIYGTLALGLAMEVTGAAELLARQVLHVGDIFESPHTRARVVLAGLYILTATLTEVMSNNAAIVLLAPIAISIGHALGMDPRPFVIAATVGASAAFATPIGYQTNTYVYGVGNYRFGDFVKIGLPLNIVYFIGCMIIIPMFWKF